MSFVGLYKVLVMVFTYCISIYIIKCGLHDFSADYHESCGWVHAVSKMDVEAFKMFNRNINSGGTNLHDTSEKGTTEPKGNEFYIM